MGFGVEEVNPVWQSYNALAYDHVALPPGYILYEIQLEEANVAHIRRKYNWRPSSKSKLTLIHTTQELNLYSDMKASIN